MTPVVLPAAPGRLAKFLAVLSVACFWLLPWSPLVAIGAVKLTKGVAGWPRRVALTGAYLSVAWTLILAVGVISLALRL